jgi:hypothetical protein
VLKDRYNNSITNRIVERVTQKGAKTILVDMINPSIPNGLDAAIFTNIVGYRDAPGSLTATTDNSGKFSFTV